MKKSVKKSVRLCLAVILALTGSACLRAFPQQVAQDDPCSPAYHTTEKLKADSKVHKEYKLGPEKNLCRLVEASSAPVLVEAGGLRELPSPPPTAQGYPDWFLRIFAHEADAVVVGVVKSNSSVLTEDGSFIFTDAQVEVQEVIKDNLAVNSTHFSSMVATYSFSLSSPRAVATGLFQNEVFSCFLELLQRLHISRL